MRWIDELSWLDGMNAGLTQQWLLTWQQTVLRPGGSDKKRSVTSMRISILWIHSSASFISPSLVQIGCWLYENWENREMLANVGKWPIPQWWRKWKTGIRAQIRITTKSQPLLEGHLLPVPAKFGRRPFTRSSVILFTVWQNEWKNDRERSHNIRLIDGGNNNNN